MCVYVYVCMYVYVCVYVCMCVYVCVYVCMCVAIDTLDNTIGLAYRDYFHEKLRRIFQLLPLSTPIKQGHNSWYPAWCARAAPG